MSKKKRTASQIGKASRAKGLSFERACANKLKEVFPRARRALECQEGLGYDLENTGCFLFQMKAYANYAPITKINEIPRTDSTKIPVLVTKGDRLEPMAVLPFSDLIKMIKMIQGEANEQHTQDAKVQDTN